MKQKRKRLARVSYRGEETGARLPGTEGVRLVGDRPPFQVDAERAGNQQWVKLHDHLAIGELAAPGETEDTNVQTTATNMVQGRRQCR